MCTAQGCRTSVGGTGASIFSAFPILQSLMCLEPVAMHGESNPSPLSLCIQIMEIFAARNPLLRGRQIYGGEWEYVFM